MPKVTFAIDKEPPKNGANSDNVELFHGIGNTLGFNITGGSDFSMPITIFHVKEGSRADKAGLKLGDAIVTINDKDTSAMTLQEANGILEENQQQDVKLGVIKFDEVDETNPDKKPQVHKILLEGKRRPPRLPFEDELRPPQGQNVESIIKSIQRQLLQISDKIPDDIMLTLLKCFAKISSLEPEPVQKSPFIRAFAKRQDSPINRGYNDDDLISSEQSEAENECTFNYKVTPSTQEVSVSIGSINDDDQTINHAEQPETEDENAAPMEQDEEAAAASNDEIAGDEGIEVEIPKISSDDEATAEEQFDEISAEKEEEEVYEDDESMPDIDDEPIPEEPPKVSLDDIEREIQQMQSFLMNKGVDKDRKKREEEELMAELQRQRELAERAAAIEEENRQKQRQLEELKDIEDTYKIDVCVKLKSREEIESSKKYQLSENYRDEVIDEGPIIDPNVPNTIEDFMRFKTHNGNKKKIFDMSWQNLCENQRKIYKHSAQHQFEKSGKNVIETQKNIKFN